MLVAYDGATPVLTTLTIHGAGPRPTPLGVFPIIRRVANETMNSDSLFLWSWAGLGTPVSIHY